MNFGLMSNRVLAVTLLVAVCGFAPSIVAQSPAYDAAVRGKSCGTSKSKPRQTDCIYRVGKTLEFSIAGVGKPDAGIVVLRSAGYDADFYFGFGVAHGCIIIWPGKATVEGSSLPSRFQPAFVSPANGKVYRSWQECGNTKRVGAGAA